MEKEELIEFIEWLNKKNNIFSLYSSSTPTEVIIKDYLVEKNMLNQKYYLTHEITKETESYVLMDLDSNERLIVLTLNNDLDDEQTKQLIYDVKRLYEHMTLNDNMTR
jgi:hypothetical protein